MRKRNVAPEQKLENSFKEVKVGRMTSKCDMYVEAGTLRLMQYNYMLLYASHVSLQC